MKINTLIIGCLLINGMAMAQVSKGSFTIGGNISSSYQKSKNQSFISPSYSSPGTTYTSFSMSPSVGYFFLKNLNAGIKFSISQSHSKSTYSSSSPTEPDFDANVKSRSLSIGPIIRYYIPVGKLYLFTQASYLWGKTRYEGYSLGGFTGGMYPITSKANNSLYSLGIGLTYFASPYVGIEFLANYSNPKKTDTVSGYPTLSAAIGLQVYLPSKN